MAVRAKWNQSSTQASLPSADFDVVTLADTNLPYLSREIHIPANGTLAVLKSDGTTSLAIPVLAGQVLPIQVMQVKSTGSSGFSSVLVIY